MKITYFEKYAKLLVEKGINLQKEETLVLTAPIEASHFAKIVVKMAYNAGAAKVIVEWVDDDITRMAFENESIEQFEEVPNYVVEKYNYYDNKSASFIFLSGTDPDNLNGIDSEKILANSISKQKASKVVGDKRMADELKWCIAGVPTKKWAHKVFPTEENSYEKLWVEILKTVRVNRTNPSEAWDVHMDNLKRYSAYLNTTQFDKMIFKNSKGTNLEVGLPKNHIFAGGGSTNPSGDVFIANMPTEEVFSLPDKRNVNGKVYSSKPLNYGGKVVEDFWFEFKDGKVVNYYAEKNQDILKELISVDDGAARLGEVALVNYDSQISKSDILYYSTLFDENASCHLALGKAYPTCLSGAEDMSKEELDAAGVNESVIHVDFMFGTEDMTITGIKGDEEVVFFDNGNFVEDVL